MRKTKTGEFEPNLDYISKEFRKSGIDPKDYLNNPSTKKQFILYVNGKQSDDIARNLYNDIPMNVPYKYKNELGEEITDYFEIVIMPIYK